MKGSASKIQLAGFDDLFQTGGKAEANGEQVQEVPLAELFPFKDCQRQRENVDFRRNEM